MLYGQGNPVGSTAAREVLEFLSHMTGRILDCQVEDTLAGLAQTGRGHHDLDAAAAISATTPKEPMKNFF
jgi:hypothetical protein